MLPSPAIVGASRPTVGAAGLAQGVYGLRGNLELVACDAADGLWVFWFNADPAGTAPSGGVAPGRWSDGLAFATGHRYTAAAILQSTLGPDHLEVLALEAGGTLQSWYWSPGPGFQRRETDAATGVVRFAAAHDEGTLTVAADDGSTVEAWESDAGGYPARSWRRRGTASLLDEDALARAVLVSAGVAGDDILPGTARRARSTRDGGTDEFTWRGADGLLRHLGWTRRAH